MASSWLAGCIRRQLPAGTAPDPGSHRFRPLLEPLPLDGVLITSDVMQATRDNAAFLRRGKNAHYLWPILGNQPNLNPQLGALLSARQLRVATTR